MTTNTAQVRILRNVSTRHGSLILREGETATAVRQDDTTAILVTSAAGYRINVEESAVEWL